MANHGSSTKRFENEFSEYLNRKHAIAVNSATAGLHLALEAIGVTEGDLIITTIYTFTATAEVIRYLGATPIFIDIDPITKNIDISLLKEAIQKNTTNIKAIIPVHFAGLACDMQEILDIAHKNNLVVVEDAAHALPTTYQKKLIGSFGDITVFSFYATKTLATGEGGMIVTDNHHWATRMKNMRLHGINRDVFDRYSSNKPSWYYEVIAPG
jgi:dTDP-4-amino-4,6-dideoxygalactose transaminase